MSSPLIEVGLAALRDGDVTAARQAFESAVAEAESGEALEGLGEALYLGCEYAMDGFARVIAGVTSPAEFFSAENVGRIMSQQGASIIG